MDAPPARDVFLVPSEGSYLVYAPLAGKVARVNAAAASQLGDFLRTGDSGSVGAPVREALGGLEWLGARAAAAPCPLPGDRHFHPTTVTLFLTNRCNLRCTYCYAAAGDFQPMEMGVDLARAGIDFVVRNARRAGRPPAVFFHGGGEPTRAWAVMMEAVDYARRAWPRRERGEVVFGLATNGVVSPEQAARIAEIFPGVTVSLDGTEDIQNAQRPRPGGGGSFRAVMDFIEVLRSKGREIVARCTVTALNVDRLAGLVDFYVKEAGVRHIHFEPAFLGGRCLDHSGNVPSPEVFARCYIEALDRAAALGATLRFSAARLMGVFSSFCGCSQDPFNLTPEGDVTACFEVCHSADPLAEQFHFGSLAPDSGRFEFDWDKLAALRSLTVQNKPVCANCFAKWNCAGDCPIKSRQPYRTAEADSPRCRMIRTITRALLERSLENKPPCKAC